MNTRHHNKDWLYQKYITEKMSLTNIAAIQGVSTSTIWKWIHRFNIPVRTISESKHIQSANHFVITDKFIEWIDGELLGDGCLYSRSAYSACVVYSSKYLEYIDYVSGLLDNFGIEQLGYIVKNETVYNSIGYQYKSKYYVELKKLYSRWYPSGKKAVPRDLKLAPVTLRQWYIGDGSIGTHGGNTRAIRLATCSFDDSDIFFLISLLEDIGIVATKHAENRIYISTKSVDKFLEYIGECPVYCYQYKWR